MAKKGFIKSFAGETYLPITRAELLLDAEANLALASELWSVSNSNYAYNYGLIDKVTYNKLKALLGTDGGDEVTVGDITTALSAITLNGIQLLKADTSGKLTLSNGVLVTGDSTYISVAASGSNIVVSHKEQSTNPTKTTAVGSLVGGVTTDDAGHVTAVTTRTIVNEDIPDALSGKTLTDSTVGADVSSSTDTLAIANKGYVDTKIAQVAGTAASAMAFKGTIGTGGTSTTIPTTVTNGYTYKIISTTTLPAANSMDGKAYTMKAGDMIVGSDTGLWYYIPAGDELQTFLKYTTTAGESNLSTDYQTGNLILGSAANTVSATSISSSNSTSDNYTPTTKAVVNYVATQVATTKADVINEVASGTGITATTEDITDTSGNVTGKKVTVSLNQATDSTLGGIKVGYTTSGKNYKVQLDTSGNAYVNVPWTDHTYTNIMASAATTTAASAITSQTNPYINLINSGSLANYHQFASANAALHIVGTSIASGSSTIKFSLDVVDEIKTTTSSGSTVADPDYDDYLVTNKAVANLGISLASSIAKSLIFVEDDVVYGSDDLLTAITF